MAVVILVSSVLPGAALNYTATTTSASNFITAEYFTVGFYSLNEGAYQPVTTIAVDPIQGTSASGGFTVSSSQSLLPSNIYIKVTGNAVPGGIVFDLDTPVVTIKDGNGSVISSVGKTITVGGSRTWSGSGWNTSSEQS